MHLKQWPKAKVGSAAATSSFLDVGAGCSQHFQRPAAPGRCELDVEPGQFLFR